LRITKVQNEAEPTEEIRIVSEFHEGLAKFEQDGKYGYVDKEGNIAVAARYDDAGDFSEQLAAVVLDGKSFFINGAGKVIISLEDYDVYTNFVEILANSGDASALYYDYLYSLSEFKSGISHSKPKLPRDYEPKTIEEAYAPKEFLCNSIDRTGKILAEDRLCEIKSM